MFTRKERKEKHVFKPREDAEAIRLKYRKPIIALIGAGDPDEADEYRIHMGMEVGYELARFCHEHQVGTLMTGGMGGVGADCFIGITKYRLKYPEFQEFFVLIPDNETTLIKGLKPIIRTFWESEVYTKLGALTGHNLYRERSGNSLMDRRTCLFHTADLFVAMNGTGGTLDEAAGAVINGKPVITCLETGGVSASLQEFKESLKNPYYPMNPIMWKDISETFLGRRFDRELIVSTDTVQEAVVKAKDMILKFKAKEQ